MLSWESDRAIHRLLVSIHTHFNAGEFDEMGELFEQATVTTTYAWSDQELVVVGGAQVAHEYRRATRLHDGLPRVQYWLSNVLIDGSEAEGIATARSQYAALVGDESTWRDPHGIEPEGHRVQPIQIFSVGRYADEFRRRDGEWILTRRQIDADLTGDRSLHMRADPLSDQSARSSEAKGGS